MDGVFITHTDNINDDTVLTVIEFDSLNNELRSLLDENLVSICEGEFSTSSLDNVKRRIIELFTNKEAKEDGEYSNWEMGAVAEFFIHLYIKSIGLKQECMFFNLEDRSAKKGFDGYYTGEDLHWIMESKSGSIGTKDISHGAKLKEALNDLQGKFSGTAKSKNNPWREAFNHASHMDVKTAEDIRTYMKALAEDFTAGTFHTSEEFNVIPCATLYFEDTAFSPKEDIIKQADEATNEISYKKAHFVCVSSKSVGIFKEYIGFPE